MPSLPSSVVRSIKKVVETANANGTEVSICGDMAHDERHIPFLLGIGVGILSMEPMYLPKIQKAIFGIALQEAKKLADTLLGQPKVISIANALFKDNNELIHGHVRA